MRGAGKRQTKAPDRFDPSFPYPPPSILPNFDLSLNMSDNESFTPRSVSPPNEDPTNDLRSLLVNFHADTKKQIEESQQQHQTSFSKLQKDMTEINTKLINILETSKAECKAYTDNRISEVGTEVKTDISKLSERLCLVEGQAARLAALEASVQKLPVSSSSSIPAVSTQSLLDTTSPEKPKFLLGPQLSSTFITQVKPASTISQPSISFNQPPLVNPTITQSQVPSSNLSHGHNHQLSSFNNTSILSQEKYSDFIPEFNGHLTSIHPEAFISDINEYF